MTVDFLLLSVSVEILETEWFPWPQRSPWGLYTKLSSRVKNLKTHHYPDKDPIIWEIIRDILMIDQICDAMKQSGAGVKRTNI